MPIGEPRRQPMARLVMAVAAIGLFLAGYYWGNQYKREDSAPPAIAGILVRTPPELADFELRDAFGQPFSADSFAGRWTLLAFADPDQANGHRPITHMIEVYNRLAADADLQAMLLLVLVTGRPPDSTIAKDFQRLSPALRFLSGDPDELQRLRASLGSPVQKSSPVLANEGWLYMTSPSKRLLALFPGIQEPASVASDLSAIAADPDSLYPSDD